MNDNLILKYKYIKCVYMNKYMVNLIKNDNICIL